MPKKCARKGAFWHVYKIKITSGKPAANAALSIIDASRIYVTNFTQSMDLLWLTRASGIIIMSFQVSNSGKPEVNRDSVQYPIDGCKYFHEIHS